MCDRERKALCSRQGCTTSCLAALSCKRSFASHLLQPAFPAAQHSAFLSPQGGAVQLQAGSFFVEHQ